jgi:membrane fusion protein, multidrug efflux system
MVQRIITVLVIIGLIGLMGWKLGNNKKEMAAKTDTSTDMATTVPVETAKASVKTINQDFEGLGAFEPSKQFNFLSEAQGKVLEVRFKEGETIKEGQVVARVDDEYQRSEMAGAALQLTKSQMDVQKLDNLVKAGGMNAQQLTDARFGIELAQNKIASANILLRKSEIKSPISGTVFRRLIEPGSILGPGSPIAIILNMEKMKFVANLSEDEMITVRTGQSVRVKADVYPDKELVGVVKQIGLMSNDAKKFPIEIEVANSSAHYLRGGLSGKAMFKRSNAKSALVVPRTAIVGSLLDAKVWVLNADNTVHQKAVKTGEVIDDVVEIKTGVAAGETIITAGQFNLVEGAKVEVK